MKGTWKGLSAKNSLHKVKLIPTVICLTLRWGFSLLYWLYKHKEASFSDICEHHCGCEGTYTSVSMAWSLVTLEKWVSRMVTVPVRATWPHPQNRATPEKQRIVATSDAYGTPPKHLMQHSKQPVQKKKTEKNGHWQKFYTKSFICEHVWCVLLICTSSGGGASFSPSLPLMFRLTVRHYT